MEKIRLGIIGAGGMACGHANCIKEIPDIEIAALADPSEKSLDVFRYRTQSPEASKRFMELRDGGLGYEAAYRQLIDVDKLPSFGSTRVFYDYRELLALEDVDAVLVATPDDTHVDIVADALASGKHVLSEKPAATNREQLNKLEEAVRSSGKIYQVGLECRYLPVFSEMRRMIENDAVGHPRMIWCLEFRGPFLEKPGNWIMFRDKTGGVFVEKTCHYFDLMNWFAGSRPGKVIALAGQDVVRDIYGVRPDIYDNGWVIVEYANGARAMLGLCMFSEHPLSVGVVGEAGKLEGFFDGKLNYSRRDGGRDEFDMKPESRISASSHGGAVYFQHLAFVDNIRNNRTPLTDIEAAKWSTLVGLAAEESAGNGGSAVSF